MTDTNDRDRVHLAEWRDDAAPIPAWPRTEVARQPEEPPDLPALTEAFPDGDLPAPRAGGWRRPARLLAVVALAAVALAAYGLSAGRAGEDAATVEVRRGRIERVVAGEGKIEPYAEVRVTASMLGRITAILVDEGDVVTKGQVLVRMEDGDLRAQLAQAEARLEEVRARYAEIDAGARPQELEAARARERETGAVVDEATSSFTRAQALFTAGLTPRAQLDEAQRRLNVALAQLQSAREQLSLLEAGAREEVKRAALAQVKTAEADVARVRTLVGYTVIRSSIDGLVVHRFMQPGEVIVMQRPEPILTLADLSRIQVRAQIDETDARFLEVGQAADITADAYPGRVFKGTVVEVGSTAGRKTMMSEDPAERMDTKVVEVIIELPEPHAWTFGVTVDASVTVERRENVPIVPRAAVESEDGQPVVLVQRGRAFERQPITIGAGDDDNVEVLSGVKEGDVVRLR